MITIKTQSDTSHGMPRNGKTGIASAGDNGTDTDHDPVAEVDEITTFGFNNNWPKYTAIANGMPYFTRNNGYRLSDETNLPTGLPKLKRNNPTTINIAITSNQRLTLKKCILQRDK